jgi:hypothetical protein
MSFRIVTAAAVLCDDALVTAAALNSQEDVWGMTARAVPLGFERQICRWLQQLIRALPGALALRSRSGVPQSACRS